MYSIQLQIMKYFISNSKETYIVLPLKVIVYAYIYIYTDKAQNCLCSKLGLIYLISSVIESILKQILRA